MLFTREAPKRIYTDTDMVSLSDLHSVTAQVMCDYGYVHVHDNGKFCCLVCTLLLLMICQPRSEGLLVLLCSGLTETHRCLICAQLNKVVAFFSSSAGSPSCVACRVQTKIHVSVSGFVKLISASHVDVV